MTLTLLRCFRLATVSLSLAASAGGAVHAAQDNAHPGIRAMLGAKPVEHLDPRSTALVIIDFQKEYFSGRMPIPDGQRAMDNAQRLLAFADRHRIPVFQIQHIAPAGAAVFAVDGQTVDFQPGMAPRQQDVVLRKETVSVFASTDLDRRLKAMGVKTIVVAGLMTHACVAGAARDAVPLGFHVVVASDASATRAITRADGRTIGKDALHEAALAEIEDTFGDVMTTAAITHLPLR
ncbi:Nicotinamidase-related amidase [Ralstonia sp. 25mfcol4.1]|nr:Nicotinamidase-related amidase [Ralstonia sp. 25mfcol4.1]